MRYPSTVAATALLALQLASPQALAHVHLVASTPASGSVVTRGPTTLVLKFSEAARVTALTIQKAGSPGVQKLAPLPNQPAMQLSIVAPTLSPGAYVVMFRALDPGDGHVSDGKFSFTVAPTGKEPLRKDAMRDTGKPPAPATIK